MPALLLLLDDWPGATGRATLCLLVTIPTVSPPPPLPHQPAGLGVQTADSPFSLWLDSYMNAQGAFLDSTASALYVSQFAADPAYNIDDYVRCPDQFSGCWLHRPSHSCVLPLVRRFPLQAVHMCVVLCGTWATVCAVKESHVSRPACGATRLLDIEPILCTVCPHMPGRPSRDLFSALVLVFAFAGVT